MNAHIPAGQAGPGRGDRSGSVNPRVETLARAQEIVAQHWPGRNATVAAWRAHHEYAANLYAQVAEVDAAHHHEALFWAGQEQAEALALDQIATPPSAGTPREGGCDG